MPACNRCWLPPSVPTSLSTAPPVEYWPLEAHAARVSMGTEPSRRIAVGGNQLVQRDRQQRLLLRSCGISVPRPFFGFGEPPRTYKNHV